MKNRGFRSILAALLLLAVSVTQPTLAQVQTAKFTSMTANSKGYYEYLPQGYNPGGSETYPLIIFIHGMGELGDGSSSKLPNVLRNGLPKVISQGKFPTSFTVNGAAHKFIVISPQFVAWPKFTDIDAIINYAIANYKVDIKRVYVTGLSMGGGATWEYGGCSSNLTYVKRTAAIVPVCGASSPSAYRARTIATYNLPVWAFHNQGDPTVLVSTTNDYISMINQAPAPNPAAKKTIFPVSGHDAWTKAYDPNYREDGKNMYEWMLQYKRDGAVAPGNTPPVANAGGDKTITLPVNTVALSGSGTDANGSISKYAWTKVSGPTSFSFSNAAIAAPNVTNLTEGVYVFRLTVTDNNGATASDDVSVVVKAAVTTPPTDTTTTPPPTGSAKQVMVNIYGGTNPYSNTQWNNWTIATGGATNQTSTAFKYTDGTTSAVKATISQTTGLADNGATYPGGMAPAGVLRHTTFSTMGRSLTITGLKTGVKYDIELYSSRSGTNGNRTVFTIGTLKDTVLSNSNYTNKVSFKGLTPNAQGQIVVSITRLNTYTYLNGFVLTEGSSSSTPVVMAKMAGSATSSLTAYPETNVTDRVQLTVNTPQIGLMKVDVLDEAGTVKQTLSMPKMLAGTTQVYISTATLPAGTYQLKTTINNWSSTVTIKK